MKDAHAPSPVRAALFFNSNSLSFLLTLLVCAVASYPGFYPRSTLGGLELLRALAARASAPPSSLVVALGTNVCVDLVVPAGEVMPQFLRALPAPS